jgi:hexosaminidase
MGADPDVTEGVSRWLQGALRPATGLSLRQSASGCLRLCVQPTLGAEAFNLVATPARICIEGGDAAGVFYGAQALPQLLDPAVFRRSKVAGVRWAVPAVQIQDGPRLAWRGAMLDVARHFMTKHEVLRFIDLMASTGSTCSICT